MEEKSTNKGGAPLGNDNHRKGKPFQDALRRAMAQNPQKLRNAAEKVLDLAEEGEPWAVNFLADRTDGKAVQVNTLETEDGKAVIPGFQLVFVEPPKENNLLEDLATAQLNQLNKTNV
mgnify:CR=1 FL=1